jgi:GNAT superfamily N-acetyltransferase
MLAPSVLPPSRLFAAPRVPFDTEVAVVSAGNVHAVDEAEPAVHYVAAEDDPEAPRSALIRETLAYAPEVVAGRVLHHLRARGVECGLPSRRTVIVEDPAHAAAMARRLEPAGLRRAALTFWIASASVLAEGPRLDLEPLIGDDAWRAWATVEREVLAEAIAPVPLTDAILDRSVQFKRRQQRDTPPIRRYVGRAAGEPIAMIGYAPFAQGPLSSGVLVRLRDVAVASAVRRRGLGRALVRAVAARAIAECGATHVLICGESSGAPAALYAGLGARPIAACTIFQGVLAAGS